MARVVGLGRPKGAKGCPPIGDWKGITTEDKLAWRSWFY